METIKGEVNIPEGFITAKEAGFRLGITDKQVKNSIQAGKLKGEKIKIKTGINGL